MKFYAFTALIFLAQIIQYSYACGGYKIELKSFKNCNNRQPIVVDTNPKNFPKVRLDSKCNLKLKGCLATNKKIRSARLNFVAKRNGKLVQTKENNIDLCDLIKGTKNPQCPVRKNKSICDIYKRPINLAKYRHILPKILGDLTVNANIITNGKDKSCFSLELRVTRKRKGPHKGPR